MSRVSHFPWVQCKALGCFGLGRALYLQDCLFSPWPRPWDDLGQCFYVETFDLAVNGAPLLQPVTSPL